MDNSNRYTPATIEGLFSIPLYQRLFEWEKEEVEQLLADLYASFKKLPNQPYFIGVLTVFQEKNINRYSLVDGQQRFTVLTLIGIALNWRSFLRENVEPRLSFFARKKDQEYLKAKISDASYSYPNQKMEDALEAIQNFFENKVEEKHKPCFKDFVFKNTTFFLSKLPENYSTQELNQYFEAMNEAGKGLENHEILKVNILKEVAAEKIEECTKIWNLISDMDKCLIVQNSDEKNQDYEVRVKNAFNSETIDILKKLQSYTDNSEKKSIKKVSANSQKPEVKENDKSEKSILTFTDFLLQVLWLTIDNKKIAVTNFFNRHQLLETFENHLLANEESKKQIATFFSNLLKYRFLFDFFIIRINSSDGQTNNFSLNFYSGDRNEEVKEYELKRQLIQYQSMLYVSTSSYIWLSFMLNLIGEKYDFSYVELLESLKKWDNKRHENTKITLKYGSLDRYWFWRLDYYLWENRDVVFKNSSAKTVADGFVFKANRSIEHIAPQTPKHESHVSLSDELLHKFGNLAMISAGQNSSLKNESYEVKRAHIYSFVNKSVGGSIESLKLLKIHEFDTWNEQNLIEHNNQMIDVLINSFADNHEIGKHLESSKSVNHDNK